MRKDRRAPSIPRWVTALQWVDRLAFYGYRAEEIVRDELLRAWVDPELRYAITERAYARQHRYLPGGSTYERGLFDWEREVLDSDAFPKKGRILLGAAGGGRELSALCERGFEVVAFEPSELLRQGAQSIAQRFPGSLVVGATYEDLVSAANDQAGPLKDALASGTFDAVILGWGSLTHVVTAEEQRKLLRAVRIASPKGAVLMSFFMRPAARAEGKADRLRTGLRSLFNALGAPPASDGIAYDMNGGFVYVFTEDEVRKLASTTGYSVAMLAEFPYPHALLVPDSSA